MRQLDLFLAAPDVWDRDPIGAFRAWLSMPDGAGNKRFSHSSARVYLVLWGRFIDHLKRQGKTATMATAEDVVGFINALTVKRPQRQRYSRVIERVLDFALMNRPATFNPVSQAVKRGVNWRQYQDNADTTFVSSQDQEMIIQWCVSAVSEFQGQDHWRGTRNRALVATMLGGGLKLSEALALTVNCVFTREGCYLEVRKPTSKYSHRTRLDGYAEMAMMTWLGVHADLFPGCGVLFPAEPTAHHGLHASNVLRMLRAMMEQQGIDAPERISPQTLRNTYAANLWEAGEGDALVCERMGYANEISARRLRAAWEAWKIRATAAPNREVGAAS